MNGVMTFINSKAFKWIGTALLIIIVSLFMWSKIETMLTNNTTLRYNNQQLINQNDTLKLNIKILEMEKQELLKKKEFDTKVKTEKVKLEEVIKTYKENGVKHEKNKNNTDTVIYYSL